MLELLILTALGAWLLFALGACRRKGGCGACEGGCAACKGCRK